MWTICMHTLSIELDLPANPHFLSINFSLVSNISPWSPNKLNTCTRNFCQSLWMRLSSTKNTVHAPVLASVSSVKETILTLQSLHAWEWDDHQSWCHCEHLVTANPAAVKLELIAILYPQLPVSALILTFLVCYYWSLLVLCDPISLWVFSRLTRVHIGCIVLILSRHDGFDDSWPGCMILPLDEAEPQTVPVWAKGGTAVFSLQCLPSRDTQTTHQPVL